MLYLRSRHKYHKYNTVIVSCRIYGISERNTAIPVHRAVQCSAELYCSIPNSGVGIANLRAPGAEALLEAQRVLSERAEDAGPHGELCARAPQRLEHARRVLAPVVQLVAQFSCTYTYTFIYSTVYLYMHER